MKDLTPHDIQVRAARLAGRGVEAKVAAERFQRIKDQREHGAWTRAQARAFNYAYPGFFSVSFTQGGADPMPMAEARYYAKCVDNQHRAAEREGRL